MPLVPRCVASFLLIPFLAAALAAQDLRIHTLDVGQGSSTLILSPTGKTMLVDGGENGKGTAVVLPAMQSLGITRLDYMVATHYDTDHIGGLDEVVLGGFLPTVAYDRGTFGGTPGTSSYNGYVSRVSSRRQTITAGTVIDMGGGVTVTCITVNGQVHLRTPVDISGSAQFENSASIGLRVEYGSFDFWVGGDLTGGGNGTSDVEGVAASVVGNLDVYTVNHHGSNTSTSATWVNTTRPEVSLVSAGSGNGFGHPTGTTLSRLVTPTRTTLVFCTSRGDGAIGPIVANDSIELTTDGTSYSVTWSAGPVIEVLCDELPGTPAGVGELVISEVHPDPNAAPESEAEWFEITATVNGPRNLRGLAVYGLSEGWAFTLDVSLLIDVDEYLTIARGGDPAGNGGHVPAVVWPYQGFDLGNTSDVVELRRGASAVDLVSYGASWPFGSGISMERRDRFTASAAANFAAGSTSFGSGDLGSPGEVNAANVPNTPLYSVGGSRTVGGDLVFTFYSPPDAGRFYVMGNSLFFLPGFFFGNAHIFLNPDSLFLVSLGVPGMSGVLPGDGRASVRWLLPNEPLLHGLGFFSQAWSFEFLPNGLTNVPTLANSMQVTLQ